MLSTKAILLLRDMDLPNKSKDRKKIAGAEWWVQRNALGSDIGFHYDKDEVFLSCFIPFYI